MMRSLSSAWRKVAPCDAITSALLATRAAKEKSIGDAGTDGEEKEFYPLWKLTLIAIPQLGVQVMWCFIGPNAAPYMGHLGVGPSLATLNNIAGPIT
ncbi:SUT5, partial [Symbiodinium microadriaticum]